MTGSTPHVKICGVRDLRGIERYAELGVDFVGLNRVPSSRRCVSLQFAQQASSRLSPPCQPVLVFQDAPATQIIDEAHTCEVRWVQLHGQESTSVAQEVRQAGLQVIKALVGDAAGGGPWERLVAEWSLSCDVLLLDGSEPGSGRSWSWSAYGPAGLHLKDVEVWLAGGLKPSNVADAIEELRPAGVDVASGVERDGLIHFDRVRDFVQAARRRR